MFGASVAMTQGQEDQNWKREKERGGNKIGFS